MKTYDGKNTQLYEVRTTLKSNKRSISKRAGSGKAENEANKDQEIKKRITLTGKKFLGKK